MPSYANPAVRIAAASRWLRPSIDERVAHRGAQLRPRQVAQLRPLGDDDGCVGAAQRGFGRRSANSTPRSVALASATGSQATTSAPSASRRAVSTRLGASRRSSVSGLNASPSSATRLPASDPRCFCSFAHRPAHLQLVDLHHGGDDVEVVPGVAGEQLQEGDVLREAAPAEAEPGAQVVRPDPPVEPHALRDVLDVGADELAHVRDLVDERDPRRQVRVRGELDHLGGRDVHAHDGCVELLVERRNGVAVRVVERADDDAVGLHEVAHGGALGEELGARGVADAAPGHGGRARRAPSPPCRPAPCYFITSTTSVEAGRQLLDHRPDRGQVRVARRGRRRADADEQELGARRPPRPSRA